MLAEKITKLSGICLASVEQLVKQLTNYYKFEGLNPATPGTGRKLWKDKVKMLISLMKCSHKKCQK